MRYWDSSAVVPLLATEDASGRARSFLETDGAIATWWATPVECASALARLAREAALTPDGLVAALARLRAMTSLWTEVGTSESLREHAIRMVRVHHLRVADAVHIAAATIAAEFQPSTLEFVTLDARQGRVAELEGFRVVGV